MMNELKLVLSIALLATINAPQAHAEFAASMVVNHNSAYVGTYKHLLFSSWGQRTHFGIDVISDAGAQVTSVAGGVVHDVINDSSDRNFGSLGYMVIIRHDALGKENKAIYSMYLHLQSAPTVQVGDIVHKGKVIGYVGTTGSANGVPHVHFELRYFPHRFSRQYNNIYAPHDARNETHAKSQWEDPEDFLVHWEWQGSGSLISEGSGQLECFGCDRDEVVVHPQLKEQGALPEAVFQLQASSRCRKVRFFERDDNNHSEHDLLTFETKNWHEANETVKAYNISLPFNYSLPADFPNGNYKLLRLKFNTDQPRARRIVGYCL